MPSSLSDQATPGVRQLYQLIQREAGQRILMAQQESPMRGRHDQEMDYLRKTTGRLPAIRGLDFIHDDFDGVVDRALRWHDRGGIVTICWHTGVEGFGYPDSKQECPDFNALLTPGTKENGLLMRRWDHGARALARLQDRGVPVLWRPFHEFDGQWFWWGKGGPEVFQRLWRAMHDYFTGDCGLHHLIWVLGYADWVKERWYPGDDCVDILGSDTYKGVTTHFASFEKLRQLSPDKPRAFHECGVVPDLGRFYQSGAVWSWLMPWHSYWLTHGNTPERLKSVYRDERSITLKELPGF